MSSIITRQEYLKDSTALFRAYYAQFVTESLVGFIGNYFGDRLLECDPEGPLNEIPLKEWDSLNGFASTMINFNNIKKAGETPALSVYTCIKKEAAKQAIEILKKGEPK